MYRKKCAIEGNEIVLKKGSKGRGLATISAEFDNDCVINYYVGFWPFKRLKQKVLWIEGTNKCCKVTEKELQKGRLVLEKFFGAGAIKNAGSTLSKVQVPALFYLIVGGVLIMQFVNLLVMSGRLII